MALLRCERIYAIPKGQHRTAQIPTHIRKRKPQPGADAIDSNIKIALIGSTCLPRKQMIIYKNLIVQVCLFLG